MKFYFIPGLSLGTLLIENYLYNMLSMHKPFPDSL